MPDTLLEARRTEKREGKAPKVAQARKATSSELVANAKKFLSQERSSDHAYGQALQFSRMAPEFASKIAESITRVELLNWLDEQAEEHDWSNSTRSRYIASLSLLFPLAVENGKVLVNPVHGIRRRQEDNTRVRFLSAEEEVKITAVLREKYPDYLGVFILALHTGARTSEIPAMHSSN
jgi:integrase